MYTDVDNSLRHNASMTVST